MPYLHERANSLGFFEVLQGRDEPWLKKRLKTYGTFDAESDTPEKDAAKLKLIKVQDLPSGPKLKKAIGVDGSIASLPYPEVNLLKIAAVEADLERQPTFLRGVLDPASLEATYRKNFLVGLLPGRGFFPKDKPGTWETKLREEFYQTLVHCRVPLSKRTVNLAGWLRKQLSQIPGAQKIVCPHCGKETIDFQLDNFESLCGVCGVEVYFSDYVAKSVAVAGSTTTGPMLILEQFLLHALEQEIAKGNVPGYDLETTLLVADGPLRLFSLPELSNVLLQTLRSHKPFPNMVAFLKSGHIANFFDTPAIGAVLEPGMVAMISEDLRGGYKGNFFESFTSSGNYGKSFSYRTLRGDKRFDFMLPPAMGDLWQGGAPVLDSWEAFPSLRSVCEFIEADQSDENGPSVATLKLIGRANNAASLPARLSRELLEELVYSSRS